MSTVLYGKNGLTVTRGWSEQQDKPVVAIVHESIVLLLNQDQLNEILPSLQGFAASFFSKPEEV